MRRGTRRTRTSDSNPIGSGSGRGQRAGGGDSSVRGNADRHRAGNRKKLNVLVKETEMADPVAPELKFTGLPTEIVKSPTWTVETAE